jgi:PEP-CTERM motif
MYRCGGLQQCLVTVDLAGAGFLSEPGTAWLNITGLSTGSVWNISNNPAAGTEASTCELVGGACGPTLFNIASEGFEISGNGGTGTTPEPSSILLLGSGILGLAGVLRRKMNR